MEPHPFDKTDLLAYVTGSCSDIRRASIVRHLEECVPCAEYCRQQNAQRTAFIAANPFSAAMALPPKAEEPAQTLRFFTRQTLALAASLILTVTAGYFYIVRTPSPDFRTKGSVRIAAYVMNREGTIETRPNSIYYPGEKLQFKYSCGAENRFMLLSIDTTGSITTYYPVQGDSSCALEPGQEIPLPNSIVLDSYTGREVFIALFSQKPLHVPAVRDRCREIFNRTRSLDSVVLGNTGITAINYYCLIGEGGR